MRTSTTVRAATLGAATALMLTACGDGGAEESSTDVSPDEAEFTLVTGVYPLEWLAAEIGGDRTAVIQLTEPGAEPHELELTGRQLADVSESDIAFYVEGLQPAVDEAVEQEASEAALNVADLVELRPAEDSHGDDDHGHEDDDHDHGHEEEDHGDDDHDDHDHGDEDPHFWLDHELMAQTAQDLADRMSEVDPEGADLYEENAESVTAELASIGESYDEGLASCEHSEVVVGHTAFTYLTEAHDLEQIGVSGVDPDTEPSPAQIAEISDVVEDRDITTVFTEPLMPDETAETISSETGADVAVLDPLEGIVDESPGDDYPSIMQGNLDALTQALGCE